MESFFDDDVVTEERPSKMDIDEEQVAFPTNWLEALQCTTPNINKLIDTTLIFVAEERRTTSVLPPPHLVFTAFHATPPENIRVVILGQDPYHGKGQAHGLCFSVMHKKPPPSLVNVFKELASDTGNASAHASVCSGNLEAWARQGVLLLNAVLTVREGKAASHAGKGWEDVTDAIIRYAGRGDAPPTAFLLWGNWAKNKASLIDSKTHGIFEAAHPSPFAAAKGFFGSKPFSKANAFLRAKGRETIVW